MKPSIESFFLLCNNPFNFPKAYLKWFKLFVDGFGDRFGDRA